MFVSCVHSTVVEGSWEGIAGCVVGSKYLEVVGPQGGSFISEGVQYFNTTVKKLDRGVQILRSSWTGGELFQEVRFFRDRSICTSGSNLKDMLRRRHNYGLVATMRMSS